MGLAELTTTPPHISRDEHTALTSSTPQSFDDIPPVLRFHDEVEITLSPGSAVNLEGRIRGSLWVTEANLAFLPADASIRPGFKLDYQSLTLHALTPASADLEGHLYCQIDDGSAAAGDDEDEYGEMRELRVFVGEGKLSPLFEALSDCSALHASLMPSGEPSSFPFFPPNEDGTFDDDDDDEWEEDGEGDMENGDSGAGRVTSHRAEGRGHILMSFQEKVTGKEGDDKKVDQVERFLGLVDWGNVPKPAGWVDEDQLQDAPGEVEDLSELAQRLGAVEVDAVDADAEGNPHA